jgi:biopolymer transport protein ExbD
MAVHRPKKVLGRSIALKSAQKHMQARASRQAYASLNLTAMVDMFTILVIFLLANFSATGEVLFMSKDIQLPKAQVTSELQRAPVVSISKASVSLEGEEVADTEEVQRPEMSDVTDLTLRLKELRRMQQMLRPGATFDGKIVMQCDEGIPFNVVRKVMYAAAEAGYTDVNHAVLSKMAETATAPAEGGAATTP